MKTKILLFWLVGCITTSLFAGSGFSRLVTPNNGATTTQNTQTNNNALIATQNNQSFTKEQLQEMRKNLGNLQILPDDVLAQIASHSFDTKTNTLKGGCSPILKLLSTCKYLQYNIKNKLLALPSITNICVKQLEKQVIPLSQELMQYEQQWKNKGYGTSFVMMPFYDSNALEITLIIPRYETNYSISECELLLNKILALKKNITVPFIKEIMVKNPILINQKIQELEATYPFLSEKYIANGLFIVTHLILTKEISPKTQQRIVKLFFEAGADANIRQKDTNRLLLYDVCFINFEKLKPIAHLILDKTNCQNIMEVYNNLKITSAQHPNTAHEKRKAYQFIKTNHKCNTCKLE